MISGLLRCVSQEPIRDILEGRQTLQGEHMFSVEYLGKQLIVMSASIIEMQGHTNIHLLLLGGGWIEKSRSLPRVTCQQEDADSGLTNDPPPDYPELNFSNKIGLLEKL